MVGFRMVGTALLAGTLAATGVIATGGSASAELPPKSIVHHSSSYWSWSGPRSWVSVDSAYGISIQGGNLGIDYGFSSIICSAGRTQAESVRRYFADQNTTLRASVRSNWRKGKVRASRVKQLPVRSYGPSYFRQSLKIKGKEGRLRMKGEIQLDYSLASGPTYCFSRSESRVAPAQGYGRSIRQLRSVQNSLAYFGPGVPGGGDNTDPDQ